MEIRQAHKQDYKEIYEFVKIAFQTAKVSDGTEQDFVLNLREGNSYIPELELIAVEDKQIIGHIMFTKQIIKTEQGEYIRIISCTTLCEIGK